MRRMWILSIFVSLLVCTPTGLVRPSPSEFL